MLQKFFSGDRFWQLIASAWLVNLALYFFTIAIDQGEAFYGKKENGNYYVFYKGQYTRISKNRFYFNKGVFCGLIITVPVSIVGFAKWRLIANQKSV